MYDVFLFRSKNEENRRDKHRGDLQYINKKKRAGERHGSAASNNRSSL
jgi:hypothetical protein